MNMKLETAIEVLKAIAEFAKDRIEDEGMANMTLGPADVAAIKAAVEIMDDVRHARKLLGKAEKNE